MDPKPTMSAGAVEARRAYKRSWCAKNRQHVNEYHRRWAAQNKDRIAEYARRHWERVAEQMEAAERGRK